MKNILVASLLSLAFANFAFARGAVSYDCAGFEPNTTGQGALSKQSVVFTFISSEGDTSIQITSKSMEKVDPANANLLVTGKDCVFDMVPDTEFPAYRVSASGMCGTKVQQNLKGMCFFQ